jgi:hypothetical protein
MLSKTSKIQAATKFGAAGVLVAAAFFGYFNLNPPPDRPLTMAMAAFSWILCPGSLIFLFQMDTEPGSTDFASQWLIIAAINLLMYSLIGLLYSAFWGNRRSLTAHTSAKKEN